MREFSYAEYDAKLKNWLTFKFSVKIKFLKEKKRQEEILFEIKNISHTQKAWYPHIVRKKSMYRLFHLEF